MREVEDFFIYLDKINGFYVDSRSVTPNSLFFALPGKRTDGHLFLKEVSRKGAFAAIVDKSYQGEDFGLFLYKVGDVLLFLQKLAKWHMEKKGSKVIGITGSFGKTTTREFVYSLLKPKAWRNIKNYNSQIGLALSILNSKDREIAVLEMGISKKKEMDRLVDIVGKMDIALITKIGPVHLENFSDVFDIAKEKMKIFLKAEKKIINYELLKYGGEEEWITFSIKNRWANYYLEKKEKINIYKDQKFVRSFDMQSFVFLENFLAAYAILDILGIEDIDTSKLIFPKMRFEKIKKRGFSFILDCYNANEESIILALKNLPKDKKKIFILGSMQELGPFSKQAHDRITKYCNKHIDHLICYKKETFYLMEKYEGEKCYFSDKKRLAQYLREIVSYEDIVLIKGSRIFEMEKILEFF